MRRLAACLLLPLVLAGCFDEPIPGALGPQEGPAGPPAVAGFRYPCPAGVAIERAEGACVGRIEDPLAQLSEPAIAMMPGRPEILAIGAHVVGPTSLVPSLHAIGGRVYFTEDAGATWRGVDVPTPEPRPGDVFSDPSLAFDAQGTLHVSGLFYHPYTGGGLGVFAVSTPDLGRSWTEPVILTEPGRNDRNWHSVGPDGAVYVSSHVCCTASFVTWSEDGGATWGKPLQGPEGCYTGSPVAFVDGEPWMACTEDEVGTHVFRLDRAARALQPLGIAQGLTCIAPRILPLHDGDVLLTCYGGYVSRSADGGATWTMPRPIADLVTVDDAWERFQVYWSDVDAQGRVHLTLLPFHRVPPDDYVLGRTTQQVAHVVLDPRTLAPLHEALLTPPDEPERDPAVPASLVPILGDDWYGMAFAEDHGWLVWTFRGGIEYARIEPIPATSDASAAPDA